jgi:hypothetical protein
MGLRAIRASRMNSRSIMKVLTAAPSGLPGGDRAVSAREVNAR